MKVCINKLRLFGHHGLKQSEKENGQYFDFYIELRPTDEHIGIHDLIKDNAGKSSWMRSDFRVMNERRTDRQPLLWPRHRSVRPSASWQGTHSNDSRDILHHSMFK